MLFNPRSFNKSFFVRSLCKTAPIIRKPTTKRFFFVNEFELNNFCRQNNPLLSARFPDYFVYTDGSCKHGISTSIGIFFGKSDERNVSKKIDKSFSSNYAELYAIAEVYPIIKQDIELNKTIVIVSDSIYALSCVTMLGEKHSNNNWSNYVSNKELVKHAYNLFHGVSNVHFMKIKAHTGFKDPHSMGNEQADRLAKSAH